jgi:hypothetical protein
MIVWLYTGIQPYIQRSRDAKRATDILTYFHVFDWYEKTFDTFPSIYGSGSATESGYCLSEIVQRPNFAGVSDQQFAHIFPEIGTPPVDPIGQQTWFPCTET